METFKLTFVFLIVLFTFTSYAKSLPVEEATGEGVVPVPDIISVNRGKVEETSGKRRVNSSGKPVKVTAYTVSETGDSSNSEQKSPSAAVPNPLNFSKLISKEKDNANKDPRSKVKVTVSLFEESKRKEEKVKRPLQPLPMKLVEVKENFVALQQPTLQFYNQHLLQPYHHPQQYQFYTIPQHYYYQQQESIPETQAIPEVQTNAVPEPEVVAPVPQQQALSVPVSHQQQQPQYNFEYRVHDSRFGVSSSHGAYGNYFNDPRNGRLMAVSYHTHNPGFNPPMHLSSLQGPYHQGYYSYQ